MVPKLISDKFNNIGFIPKLQSHQFQLKFQQYVAQNLSRRVSDVARFGAQATRGFIFPFIGAKGPPLKEFQFLGIKRCILFEI